MTRILRTHVSSEDSNSIETLCSLMRRRPEGGPVDGAARHDVLLAALGCEAREPEEQPLENAQLEADAPPKGKVRLDGIDHGVSPGQRSANGSSSARSTLA